MAAMGFGPQAVAVASGGLRKKIRSPYVDLIRGQYGQATQNVLQQRQEDQAQTQRMEDVSMANKQFQAEQANALNQLKLQKQANKDAARAGMIGTVISGAGALGNLANAAGGFSGLASGVAGLPGTIGKGVKNLGSSLFGSGGLFSSFFGS